MKLRILSTARLSFPLAAALAALLAVPSANAAVLTWNNGAATGNWNTADLNWSGASPWSNATPDDAVFGATGVGTVTLTEAITAGSVTINTAGYTITGNTITLNSGVTALTSNAASTVNSNVTLATAAGTITSSVGTLTLGGTLDAGSLALTFDGAGSTTVSNAISNGTALTKNGAGTLTLSGANTYTGGTTVTDGRLIATSGSALGSGSLTVDADKSFAYRPTAAGPLNIGGTLNLGNGTTTNIGAALGGASDQSVIAVTGVASLLGTGVVNVNFISGVAPAPGTNQLITAASGLDGGTYTLGTVFNNSDYTVTNFQRTGIAISVDVATATALSGNVLWKGGLAGNTGVWAASTGLSGGASNWQVTNGVDQPLVPGATADLVFSAANSPGTMAGMTLGADMTLQSLTVNNTATNFGLGADGSTLTLTPASPAGGITLNTGVLASTIAANVALGADQTWTNNSANTLTVSGVVSGGFSLTKAGTGTISLTGANTYSGTTVINGGTLTVTGSLNGTIGTALTFGGSGTLNVAEAANSAQGMGALTLTAGDGTVTSTAAGATSIATLTFGSLGARSAGATANLTLATNTSSVGATPNKIVFTDTTNVPLDSGSNNAGIFFGGANYALYDAAGFVRAVTYGTDINALTAFSGTGVTTLVSIDATKDAQFVGASTTTTTASAQATGLTTLTVASGSGFKIGQAISGTGITANTFVTGISGNVLNLSQAAGVIAASAAMTPYNSVSEQATGSVNTVNLSGPGSSLTLAPGATLSANGILRSAGTANVVGAISGGIGIQAFSSGGEMVIRTDGANDTLNIRSVILDNGVSSLTKSGAGTLLLSGANTYAGGTFLNGGTVTISNANSFGVSTPTTGTVTVNGASQITATVGITYANNIVVNGALSLRTSALGTASYSGVISGSNPIIVVSAGLGGGNTGNHAFTNTGNTFTGNVIMPAATGSSEEFSFASIGDGGSFIYARPSWREAVIYTGYTDAPNIVFNTRQIVLASTIGTATGVDGNGRPVNQFQNNSATSAVTFNTNMSVPATSATSTYFTFAGTNAGNNTFAGTIADIGNANTLGIAKRDAGKWILTGANSYLGNAWVADGTLSVNAIDVAANNQPLGMSSLIQFGNQGTSGTLEFTGTTNSSTDKQIQLGNGTAAQTGAGTIRNIGTGSLTFTNATFNQTITGITATRTLTLGGTYAEGTNEVQGIIQNNSSVSGTGAGLVALAVSGSTWKLSGANTYTGLTTVSGGTLQIGNAGALGFGGLQRNVTTSGTTVSSTGSLDLNGTTGISEPITLSGSSASALVNSNTGAAASIGSGIAGIQLSAATTGTGYSAPPTITFSSPGTGATAVASLGVTVATFGTPTLTGTRSGSVTAVITGGGGTGARATVTLAGVITITNPGTGYTSAPTITVTVQTGGGTITYTPNADNFTVSAVQMTNAGSGYTGTPTYTFSGNAVAGTVTRSAVILSANSSIGGAGDMTIDAVVSQSGGAPGLTKVGAGTLTLTAANTYTGNTNVSEGALILADNAQLSFVLGASGINNSITGAGTVTLDGDFSINTAAADGLNAGSWILENVDTLAGAYGSSFTVTGFTDIGGDKWEKTVGSKIYTFDETTGTLTLFTPDPFPAWAASKGLNGTPGFENGKGDDPDGDGFTNLDEFAFDGNPLSGANDGKIVGKIATVGPDQVMTLTLPVRNGATFANDGGDQLSALIDGIYYRVEGSLDLSVFANTVTEVTPTITAGLPALSSGWTYRSFRAPGTVPTVSRTFLRVKASETP